MKKIFASVLALMLVLGTVGCSSPNVKTDAEFKKQETKYDQYENAERIVSALEATEIIEKGGNIVIVDVRKADDYILGHIDGAVNVWREEYGADKGEYEYGGMRSSREKMAKLLGNLGIDKNTKIIVYSGHHNYDATRFMWQLELFGHDNAVLIDGGVPAWKAAGLDTTTSKPNVTAKEYQFPGKLDETKLATLEEVKAAIDDPNVVIWDTRSIKEATGEELKSGATRKGRIPSAVWLEYKELIHGAENEDATFKTATELKELLESKGITPDKTIILYCQSSVRSSLATFVLETLGYKNVKNYDGSWIEWSYNKDLPIETGEIK